MTHSSSSIAKRMIGDVAVVDIGPASTERPPIVMVHGGHHGAWCWEPLQTLFADAGWSTTALDWLNRGSSAPLERQEWLRRDIVAVRREVGLVCEAIARETGQAPIVMGHSMGGLATLAHATLNDQPLTAMVLLAPVVTSGHADARDEESVDPDEPSEPPPFEIAQQLFFTDVGPEDAKAYYALLEAESPAAVWQATRWTAELPLEKLRGLPVLAIGAGRDPLVPAEAVRNLSTTLNGDFHEFPDAGHGLTLDPVHRDVFRTTAAWLQERVLGQ
ncbi:pimeloyl-ACP methyl ester carboxylesterase [Streptomyces sp. B4I13]|uniref:alpha/beta hydrolase n=1 Tax=Streptomyces sp. B4I13 TaxID=3042271 RepID=UPI00277F70A6|nr:alpha/beta fold hydrolase [Streptomyces sp. B4I13]MDQ0963398.1 pimeloyl-ACP methyl ester carboxylesterase [Streptomyces sp. B4I13]